MVVVDIRFEMPSNDRVRKRKREGRSCVGMWQIAELPAGREPFTEVEAPPRRTKWTSRKDEAEERTMYVVAVRRHEAGWKAEAAGNLWFKESDPSCDMPGFNRRHLFVKSVPKDSPCRSSSPPRLSSYNSPIVSARARQNPQDRRTWMENTGFILSRTKCRKRLFWFVTSGNG